MVVGVVHVFEHVLRALIHLHDQPLAEQVVFAALRPEKLDLHAVAVVLNEDVVAASAIRMDANLVKDAGAVARNCVADPADIYFCELASGGAAVGDGSECVTTRAAVDAQGGTFGHGVCRDRVLAPAAEHGRVARRRVVDCDNVVKVAHFDHQVSHAAKRRLANRHRGANNIKLKLGAGLHLARGCSGGLGGVKNGAVAQQAVVHHGFAADGRRWLKRHHPQAVCHDFSVRIRVGAAHKQGGRARANWLRHVFNAYNFKAVVEHTALSGGVSLEQVFGEDTAVWGRVNKILEAVFATGTPVQCHRRGVAVHRDVVGPLPGVDIQLPLVASACDAAADFPDCDKIVPIEQVELETRIHHVHRHCVRLLAAADLHLQVGARKIKQIPVVVHKQGAMRCLRSRLVHELAHVARVGQTGNIQDVIKGRVGAQHTDQARDFSSCRRDGVLDVVASARPCLQQSHSFGLAIVADLHAVGPRPTIPGEVAAAAGAQHVQRIVAALAVEHQLCDQ